MTYKQKNKQLKNSQGFYYINQSDDFEKRKFENSKKLYCMKDILIEKSGFEVKMAL